ncbi:unnamed protein product [Effrenium voratum]|nr:unnamed protein product [Effrenium voratum]
MVLGAEAMPHFEPERSTTGDVVWQAIIPATASRGRDGCGSSLASLLPAGPADLAPRMVTHHWGNRFVDLVAAVVADALGLNHFDTLAQNLSEDHAGRRSEVNKLKEKLWNRGLGDQPYWICAVCINQHSSICNNPRSFCDTVTGQPVPCCECDTPKILNDQYLQCELNKFDDMMMHLYYVHGSAFVQVLAIDRDFEIFSRAWCLAEMVQADACRMDQHVLLHSPEALEKNSARLVSIRVQDCSATRPEDKEAILSNIGGAREQEQFNDRLRDLLLGAKGLLAKWLDGQTNLQGIGAVAARVKAETRAHEDEDSEEESLGGLPLERTLSAAHAWAQAAFEAATKADAVLTTAGVIAAQARRGETRDLTDTTTSAFFRVRSSSNTERKDLVLAGLADTTSSSPWRIRSEDSMSRKDEECLSPASPMRCLQVDTAASSPWCRRDDSESEQEDQTQDLGTEPSADAVAPEFRLSL